MEPQPDESEHHSLLAPAIKLVIMAASLALASFVGFYLHPHLLPILSESIPQLWSSLQAWLTAPILFLLLNLVVGTLYFSSGMLLHPASRLPDEPPHAHTSPPMSSAAAKKDGMLDADADADAVPAANSSRSVGGLRARIEKSRTFSRLVRSKSEQIPPSAMKADVGGSRLKKAGTFEAAAQGTRMPMVIVADPPEDEGGAAQPGHEEVDKRAEDFISRFYQKVKLQRLDSLLRNQQNLQQG